MLEFAAPLLLTTLVTLPALWWLLRLTPPKPRREVFPALKILLSLPKTIETPANTPWWLLLLRLLLAAALIFALAGPLLNALQGLSKSDEPVTLVIDTGATSAKNFDKIIEKAQIIIQQSTQGIILAPTSELPSGLLTPTEAKERLAALKPAAYLTEKPLLSGHIIYLSDGFSSKNDAAFAPLVTTFIAGLPPFSTLHEVTADARGLSIKAQGEGVLVAKDAKGLILAETPLKPTTQLDLPLDLRNLVTRLEIKGERHAGAVHLIDRRLRKKAATVISGATNDAQSLLSPVYYLERALQPFTERKVIEGASPSEAVIKAINEGIPMILLTDVGTLTPQAITKLSDYVEQGGMFIRFAGNRTANDTLMPVKLRQDVRQMGGSLSWDKPRKLIAFPAKSPFKDLEIPQDVTVSRQVLAEPDGFLADKTWALLDDGTPIVTGITKGRGLSVLFHIQANAAWSNLALSGLFPQMIERLVQLAGTTERVNEENTVSAPLSILDGFGAFITPPANAEAIEKPVLRASKQHPAGLYGFTESPLAVNVFAEGERLKPLDLSLFKSKPLSYSNENEVDFRPWLLILALGFFILDSVIVLKMGGHIRKITFILALFIVTPVEAVEETRLAFVKTGNISVDRISEAGLNGLSKFIAARTTLEPGAAKGIDFEKDDLALSPVIYWAVSPETTLTTTAKIRLEAYLKNGGLLIIDTKDAHITGQRPFLRQLLISLDLPELVPVPKDHVLGRSYYLLDQFVGRYTNGETWVEALNLAPDDERPAKASDGVSPVIITSNDLAGAWAVDERGQAMLPADSMPRQREMAYRAGVNMVFYALTGNYKADQVHAPALLERLGRGK